MRHGIEKLTTYGGFLATLFLPSFIEPDERAIRSAPTFTEMNGLLVEDEEAAIRKGTCCTCERAICAEIEL